MNPAQADVAMLIGAKDESTVDRSRDWRRLTYGTALVVTLAEAVLLQRKYGLFTGGFLSVSPFGTWIDGVAFLGVMLLLNAAAAAPFCAVALVGARAIGLRPWAVRLAAVGAGAAPILTADFLKYQLWSYLGDAFDLHLMFDLTGRRVSEIFAVAAPLVARPLMLTAMLLCGVVASIWIVNTIQRDGAVAPVVPAPLAIGRRSIGLVALAILVALGMAVSSESMAYGLRRTPVGSVTLQLLDWLTDFDGDGYGLVRSPRDAAPFDSTLHPYAVEVPGNGIDENGLAGDLPLDRATYLEPPPPSTPWRNRPPVLLFVLESFRADVVGAWYDGQPVTPVMDALGVRGAKVDSAWSHNGFTRQSRFHILTGSFIGRRGTSLIDDFKNNGYTVAYFSGQDDSAFGNPEINYDRVDKYYDARQDLDRRYSAYTTPGSLAVPFNVLEERIGEYLHARRSTDPLFMYVNFHDTHYPYSHPYLRDVFGPALPPSLISPARRGDLWRTYLNAAANVDSAIGRVIDNVTRAVGVRPAVVIISDHGESLLDGGMLGHGYALTDAQTRIPLVVEGLPMRIQVPFGQSSLRDAINAALAGEVAMDVRPVVERGKNPRVFQYLGPLDTPGQIGWLTNDDRFTYDFRSNRVGLWDGTVKPDDLVGEPQREFIDLVHYWESIQLALARSHQPAGDSLSESRRPTATPPAR